MTDKSQFDIGKPLHCNTSRNIRLTLSEGHQVPIQHQKPPGAQNVLDPQPASEQIASEDGGYQIYKAAGKLKGKKALITGGDSGIGRATAILFAMEGGDSFIAYLPHEEKDAQETKSYVEKYGQQCHLLPIDLKKKENCMEVVQEAMNQMGAINILFNNHAYQMQTNSILELDEEQWEHTFDTNIHRECAPTSRKLKWLTIRVSFLLPLEIYPTAHAKGRYNHQQRLYKCLRGSPGSSRLH